MPPLGLGSGMQYTTPLGPDNSQLPPAQPKWRPHGPVSRAPPTDQAIKRITSDLRELIRGKDPTIYVSPDAEDVTHVHAMIIGVEDTPYAHGFFHFDMQFPHDFPWNPPVVTIETTDGGRVRFNPNLYANGKVCLSILGTWSGPAWSEIQTIRSVLMSIQSLMNENPYHNEPGHETERTKGDIERYNECILHETLRVAVCGMMENPTCGEIFRDAMDENFLKNYDWYIKIINESKGKDGQVMTDPFGMKRGRFRYASLLPRLATLKTGATSRIEQKRKKEEEERAKQDAAAAAAATATKGDEDQSDSDGSYEFYSDEDEDEAAEENAIADEKKTGEAMQTETKTPISKEVEMTIADNANSSTPVSPSPSAATTDNENDDKNITLIGKPETLSVKDSKPTEPASNQFDADAELARQLQEQMYKEMNSYQQPIQQQGYPPAYGYGRGSSYGAHGFVPYGRGRGAPVVAPKVKGLTLADLAGSDETKDSDSTEKQLQCLICKCTPTEYIVPPACHPSHVYCYPCAESKYRKGSEQRGYRNNYHYHRRGKQPQASKTFVCVLCSAKSAVDSVDNLRGLKRRRKRKRGEGENNKICPKHGEEFNFFCMKDQVLICFKCCGDDHRTCDYEALDQAKNKLVGVVESNLQVLSSKWNKTEEFVKAIEKRSDELDGEVDKKIQDVKQQFSTLKDILAQKEKELEAAIKRVGEQKKKFLTAELEKGKAQLEGIPDSITKVQTHLGEKKDALAFLEFYEDNEESLRHLSNTTTPEIKPRWFQMPQLVGVQPVQAYFERLKYVDKPRFYGDLSNMPPSMQFYDDEDAYDY